MERMPGSRVVYDKLNLIQGDQQMDSANRMDDVARVVDYLAESRHLPHDDQIKGLYARWPGITPQDYVKALKLFHKREHAARKKQPVKRKLPQILARLKNKSAYMTKATFTGVSWKKVDGAWLGKASWSL
jgi:hypothetical protein